MHSALFDARSLGQAHVRWLGDLSVDGMACSLQPDRKTVAAVLPGYGGVVDRVVEEGLTTMPRLRVRDCSAVGCGRVLEIAAKVRLHAGVVLVRAGVGPLLPPAIEEPVLDHDLLAQLDSYQQDYP